MRREEWLEHLKTLDRIYDPARVAAALDLPTDFGPDFPMPHTLTDEELETNYLGGFMVRDGDEVRPLRSSEMGHRERLAAKRALQALADNGCCGQRAANGECEARCVVAALCQQRRSAGMKQGTLRAIGTLCPHSELWAAWEVTHDTGAVAAAIGMDWEGD